MNIKLGKKPAKRDNRNIKLSNILSIELPELPSVYSCYTRDIPIKMWKNDIYGNCVIVGRTNQTLIFEKSEQNLTIPITEQEVLDEYWKEGNRTFWNKKPDEGLVMLDSLKHWKKDGWIAGGRKYDIYAYGSINLAVEKELKYAIYLLQGAQCGFALPQSCVNQFRKGEMWTITNGEDAIVGSLGGHCFTGDTKIQLLNGTDISLKELSEKYHNKQFYVYSWDNKKQQVVPGLAHSPRLTQKNVKIISVELDNGEIIKCTQNHKFMLRNGNYIEAKNLKPNDSLMPLYKRKNSNGYEEILYNQKKWKTTHSIMFSGKYTRGVEKKPNILHHIDCNKNNNEPNNLVLMSWSDHQKLHSKLGIFLIAYNKSEKGRNKSRELMKKLMGNKTKKQEILKKKEAGFKNWVKNGGKTGFALWNKEKLSNAMKEKWIDVDFANKQKTLSGKRMKNLWKISNFRDKMIEKSSNRLKKQWKNLEYRTKMSNISKISAHNRWHIKSGIANDSCDLCKQPIINHKVVRVSDVGYDDVYDITVEKYHNFALSSGVFVHNCVYVCGFDEIGVYCITWGKIQKMDWEFFRAYCVSPDTKILTKDLIWKNAIDLNVTDELLTFEEYGSYRTIDNKMGARKWKIGSILEKSIIKRPCYELVFEDGTKLYCSSEHRWLAKTHNGNDWIETRNLRCDNYSCSRVVKPLDVWDELNEYDSGYLAASIDGEGCIMQRNLGGNGNGWADTRIDFCQRQNDMWENVIRILNKYNISYCINNRKNLNHLTVHRRSDFIKLLGIAKPKRLMKKFNHNILGLVTTRRSVKLISKKYIGEQYVVAIKTNTGTYLANGLASHNCDEAYAIVDNKDKFLVNSPIDIDKLNNYLKQISN